MGDAMEQKKRGYHPDPRYHIEGELVGTRKLEGTKIVFVDSKSRNMVLRQASFDLG